MEKKHKLVLLGMDKYQDRIETHEHVRFLKNDEENEFLNNLTDYPHAFVLACLMDKQIKAEKAWHIPYRIKEIVGDFDIDTLSRVKLEDYINIFNDNKLHRFNNNHADIFYHAVHRIKSTYDGDISRVWNNRPSSASVVYDFLQFKGAGVKIANMIANILARDFLVPFSDYYSIDISPDTHVVRVMRRAGLVAKDADRDSIIYKARELNPDFPGIMDYSCWEIGRLWCHPKKPECKMCVINKECLKHIDAEVDYV